MTCLQKFSSIVVGVLLIVMAISGQLCALLMTIPEPVMAAFILLLFMLVLLEGNVILQQTLFYSI